ncbi:pyruvate kinase-like [Adelges cooleyi]|uniref:pyruvate kinase-like n=1 Tax=Adelges cooleyi TaxID=133065 RepID=UPI0021809A31|nr:pyruvate kinase-like [Adelges cooleyi]
MSKIVPQTTVPQTICAVSQPHTWIDLLADFPKITHEEDICGKITPIVLISEDEINYEDLATYEELAKDPKEEDYFLVSFCNNDNSTETKATFENNYLDHMSNLKTNSTPSPHTLTTMACAVSSSITKEVVAKFCERGVSMIVVWFNELSNKECQKMIFEIRQGVFNYSLKINRIPYSLAIVLNLEGQKIFTGNILKTQPNQSTIRLSTNEYVYVTNDVQYREMCSPDRIYVGAENIMRLKQGDPIYLDYGKIELVVQKVGEDRLHCLIKRGEVLGSKRVVHIPGIPIPAVLTEDDEERVRTAIQHKIDVILIPGVRDAAFVNRIKDFVRLEKGLDIDFYAKIDNSIGLENIDEILPIVDGVFLDLPSLSMEIGHDKIFIAQKIILSKCNIVGKPTITHGSFLSSMENMSIPSSSEVNDVINTVLDVTDAIYLDVTVRSSFQVHCIEYLSHVCRRAESAIWEQQLFNELNHKSKPKVDPAHAFSIGCVEVSLKCYAKAIVVISTSGLSARTIARYRPRCPIIAIIKQGKAARKLSVWRNLITVHFLTAQEMEWSKDIEARTKFAMSLGKTKGILKNGDLVIQMCGNKQGVGFTNTMRLLHVNSNDVYE